jgi:hypothetical protein
VRSLLTPLSLAAGLAVVLLGAAEEQGFEALSVCCEDLQIPRGGPSGNPGDKVGPIRVTITPDHEGHASSIEIEGASSPAGILVRSWLSGSKFSTKCAGKRLSLRFSFVVEGPPSEYPFSWVTFQSPNHFIVHSRARTPTVLHPPEKGLPEAGRR